MKRTLGVCLLCAGALLMTGCSNKFEPTESTLFVTSKGMVYSAVMESFEAAYYNYDELAEDVQKAVSAYCGETNPEAVTVESLVEENDMVTLLMHYETVDDYAKFNEVILFSGTLSEAMEAGYRPEHLLDADGEPAEFNMEEHGALKVVVTEENVCVQTTGKIKFVSDNVSIIDSKLAKTMEAGESELAFVLYK